MDTGTSTLRALILNTLPLSGPCITNYMRSVDAVVSDFADGKFNLASARMPLLDALDALGYTPEEGFPDEDSIPGAAAWSLGDLSERRHLDLLITTRFRFLASARYVRSWETRSQRRTNPAWELVRIYPNAGDEPDMEERWRGLNGSFNDGRMIALIDDEIWIKLGSAAVFQDAFDRPYPPFALGSGYGIRSVDRRHAVALGLITENQIPNAPAGVVPLVEPEEPRPKIDKAQLGELRAALDIELKDWDSGELMRQTLKRAAGEG